MYTHKDTKACEGDGVIDEITSCVHVASVVGPKTIADKEYTTAPRPYPFVADAGVPPAVTCIPTNQHSHTSIIKSLDI